MSIDDNNSVFSNLNLTENTSALGKIEEGNRAIKPRTRVGDNQKCRDCGEPWSHGWCNICSAIWFREVQAELDAAAERRRQQKLERHTKTRYELGAREFTLTYSPKWCTDEEAKEGMITAINRLCGYYADEIVKLRAVGEVGSNGLSHIHCYYKLQKGLKITDKNFKRAWKHWNPKKKLGWGFEGGHHASVKNEADFLGYIDKEVDHAWFEKNVAN
jgi:hypothetical protein